jgi:hypothetical protein
VKPVQGVACLHDVSVVWFAQFLEWPAALRLPPDKRLLLAEARGWVLPFAGLERSGSHESDTTPSQLLVSTPAGSCS